MFKAFSMLFQSIYHWLSAINNVAIASDTASSVLIVKADHFKEESIQELNALKTKALSV